MNNGMRREQTSLFESRRLLVKTQARRSLCRHPFLITFLVVSCVWLVTLPAGRAVNPPPDGGYPNQTTAEGDNALLDLTTGFNNTAIGFDALLFTNTGSHNTALGANALASNTTGSGNTASGTDALVSNTSGGSNTATGE